MTDNQAMRQWLVDHGRTPPARGPVSAADRAYYEENAIQSVFAPPPADAGVTDADFDALDSEPDVPLQPERRPRTPRTTRTRRPGGPLRLLTGGEHQRKAKDSKRGGRKHPRVSLERLTGRLWESAGRIFGTISPAMGNCMQIQAPVAGMILEDIVKGTLIDKPLQPIARAEEKFEKAFALAGPPVCVLAIEHAQTLEPREAALRTAVLMPMLREGLAAWIDVAGDKVEAAAQRRTEYAEKQAAVDAMIAAIFGQPLVTTTEQVAEERVPA